MYPRTLLCVLCIHAIIVTCLMFAVISEMFKYEVIWNQIRPPNDHNYLEIFRVDHILRRFNWFAVIFGVWFELFFAVDSQLHHNAMQVLVIPVFNGLLFAVQCYEFVLMAATKTCFEGVQSALEVGFTASADNITIPIPDACAYTNLVLIKNRDERWFSRHTLAIYQSNHPHLPNALNLSLATVVIMSVLFLGICCLSFKTYRHYGWTIYRINGADIQKRDVLTRYHVFILALKLNIYFAACTAVPFLFTLIGALVFDLPDSSRTFQRQSNEIRNGGYGIAILTLVISAFCMMSVFLFYFVGIRAIRKNNYWLMGLLLVVYLVQVCLEGRYVYFWLVVDLSLERKEQILLNYYLGTIVAVEMAFDIFIVLMGSWVMYDFKHGLSRLVNEMYEHKPWILFKKPEHLQPKKERFVID